MSIKLPKISIKCIKNKHDKIDTVILKYNDYQKIITTMDKLKLNIKKLKQKSLTQKRRNIK
ncbi:hypothetical protein KBD08_03795 [Candidatus Babeliales bacterium]|nr:hypothetical protein [Candidatus Babeliales bacterium]